MDISAAFGLPEKVAVVTGGGSGIGEATAQVLAAAGATVVVADRDAESAERVAAAIESSSGRAVARPVDVADPDSVDGLVAGTTQEFGRLDIMVNNAGIMERRPLLEVSPEAFERILAVNLKGVLYGSQAAARVMGRGSSIVNVLSTIIDSSTVGTGSYAASKKGAEALTRTFAIELGPQGIRVNGVAPGWTVTGITRQRGLDGSGDFDAAQFDEVVRKMAAASPLNSIIDPIDSAYAVLYLVAEAGRFMTGQVIRTNGGMSMV